MTTFNAATGSPTVGTDEERRHVAKLVSDARIAMFTTVEADGTLVSRPMALQEAEFDGTLWFFADENSREVAEIRANPNVNISFSNNRASEWTSIAGTAEALWDRAKAEQMWSAPMNAWFVDGLDTEGITLIRVTVSSAQYWDGPGNPVVQVFGMLRAALLKDPSKFPDTDQATVEY